MDAFHLKNRLSFFRLWTALFACIAVTVCTSCKKSEEQAREHTPVIALVMKSLANEFFSTMAEGARRNQQTNSTPYQLLVNGMKNETDLAEQVGLVEQMLARRVNAIVIAPARPGG